MLLEDALAAEPVPRLGAAAAVVVSEKLGLVADVAMHIRPVQLGSLACGHPEESARTVGPCSMLCGVVQYVPLLQPPWGYWVICMASLSAEPVGNVGAGCSRYVGRLGLAVPLVYTTGRDVVVVHPPVGWL